MSKTRQKTVILRSFTDHLKVEILLFPHATTTGEMSPAGRRTSLHFEM
jgi:hypothetical protein